MASRFRPIYLPDGLSALGRLIVAAFVALALVGLSALLFPVLRQEREMLVLVTWCGAVGSWLALVWHKINSRTPAQTQAIAMREDDSRYASAFLLLVGAMVSLFAVGFSLVRTDTLFKLGEETLARGLTATSVLTVLLTWLLIQTEYTLHYARLYYSEPIGGINFDGEEPPSYTEFAYLSFTIGMTYQVSDTNLSKREIRRVLLHHALLSYLFSTVLIALTIAAVTGLVR